MTEADHKKRWVLVVEDDLDMAHMLVESLQSESFKVLAVNNSQDAVRMLTNQKFDCVLLDLKLERGGGEQVVSSVRRDKLGFNFTTPILIVSGELNAEIVQKIRGSVTSFFVKPFDLGKLVAKVKELAV